MTSPVDPLEGHVVLRRSTNVLSLVGLIDEETGAYPIDATVTVTLFDLTDTPVPGAEDLDCTYVAGTKKPDTVYRAMLAHNVALPDAEYRATFTITRLGAVREMNTRVFPQDG